MQAAHDEYTSAYVYNVLTGWWWDRHEHDGPPQDAALIEEQPHTSSAFASFTNIGPSYASS